MSGIDWIVWRNIAAVGLIVVILFVLGLAMKREWVKEDLRKRGHLPVRVRWSLFGPSLTERLGIWGTVFRVSYRDLFGNEHEGWCVVPRYRWRQLKWLRNKVASTTGNGLREL